MNEEKSLSIKTVLFYILTTILVFFYIYRSNLTHLGFTAQLHSLRLSAVVLVVWALIKKATGNISSVRLDTTSVVYRSWRSYIKVILALFVYSIALLVLVGRGSGNTFFDTMLNMVLFTIPVVWAFTILFDNATQFMRVLLFAGIIQSVIIIYCLSNDSFALLLDSTFNLSDTDYTAAHRDGYAGGLGCITAPGVIRYSTGLIACVFFYLKEHKTKYLLLFTVFAILSSMIARTGILIDVVCLFAMIIGQNNMRKFIVFAVPLAIILFVISNVVSSGGMDTFLSERYARVMMLQETGVKEGFFDHYFNGENTEFPPLNMDMIIGTGIISGTSSNGYVINVDGGPLRIYSAIGILFCIVVYFFLIKQMVNISKSICTRNLRIVMWLYMALLLLSDFKEITFFIVYPMCIYYTVAFLINKEDKIQTI